jgi:hypothetical protein
MNLILKIYLVIMFIIFIILKKKNSQGATKFIAKMHLNQLYGIFGRKKELIQTINVHRKDLNKYLLSKFKIYYLK